MLFCLGLLLPASVSADCGTTEGGVVVHHQQTEVDGEVVDVSSEYDGWALYIYGGAVVVAGADGETHSFGFVWGR